MKTVAKTILDMTSGDTLSAILDYSQSVGAIAETLLEHWSYDLYARKPGPAYFENGVFVPTDLDLACFMSALVDRGAVINLPTYEGRRPKVTREGERVLSARNRHGKVLGLSANKEVFSFSTRIEDMNVVSQDAAGQDKVGAFRSFMLVDIDGSWHEGWSKIEFMPTAQENDFLKDKELWTASTVFFKNFVHPNRWISFYGQYYFLTKALIARLEMENEHKREQEKTLLASGLSFPTSGDGAKQEWPKSTQGGSVAEKVQAFACEVDVPWTGTLRPLERTVEALVANAKRIKLLQYGILPRLRFAVRATELAFVRAGMKEHPMPSWMQGAKWEEDYVVPGKRNKWNRLVHVQKRPGQIGFALRYRVYEKTERVAP